MQKCEAYSTTNMNNSTAGRLKRCHPQCAFIILSKEVMFPAIATRCCSLPKNHYTNPWEKGKDDV